MSVSFAKAVAEGLQAHGIPVRWWPGWEFRGNGQTSNYQGLSLHHTASNYGKAYATLANGRAGLSGPLCNSSGDDDGGVTIIAAHPANHAGASGGRAMGPLPTTRTFNKLMWGHEIVYPGTKPMTDAQYRTAVILSAVVSQILKRPNADWVRGHAETSVTGKWDPGYANGKTYDLNALRAQAVSLVTGAPVGTPSQATFRKGDKGNGVKEIQEALNAALHLKLVADGDFGPATESAVKAFQALNGLTADGIVGPATRARLLGDEFVMASKDEVRALLREELSRVAKRDDLGFARNQILTALGVDDPENAPATRTTAENDAIEPARRVDVGYARDQILDAIAKLQGMLEELDAK